MAPSALLIDRFVSASSVDDARESLNGIVAALQETSDDSRLDPSSIWTDEKNLEAFLQVLTSGEFKGISIDQGPPIICQIFTEIIRAKGSFIVLQKPEPGRLVQSLLDVICNSEDSAYARVSSLQLLQKICHKYPSIAQSQLLEVPNGLHRLADTFREDNEQVRNELLLLAMVIAQWPSCARIWVFADVCDSVIELAVREGGLTNGSLLVSDCLDLLQALLRHDVSLSDLVWQSRLFASKLSSLLDLRRGIEFLNPQKTQPTDDLDDILQSGTENFKEVVPRLIEGEEGVLAKVLDLLGIMLGSESIRMSVWKRHTVLGSLMWELSLLSPPPPGIPYVCAVPSANLQQMALHCVAEFFNSVDTMQRHNGLDRLLYLVCTGGSSDDPKKRMGLSLSALHVIRRTLSDESARNQVLHTLAPPSTSDDSVKDEPTVVVKLMNTVLENINSDTDLERRQISLLGSLGALGVFMRDQTTREMMLRIASPHALIDLMLKSLQTQNEFLALCFLRFLSEWTIETPAVVESILSSTESTALSVLFGSSGPKATFAGLLLGMTMEYMDDQKSENYGGWTRSSILAMISKQKGGVSGFMSRLEELKTADLPWKVCELEERTFQKWYGNQVLVVRRRVVQELTGGVSDDDGDDAPGIGLNSLQKLVAKQSEELDGLRRELAEANAAVKIRDSELSIWKRRVESNPTQLDQMLSDYSTKNIELENSVLALRLQLASLVEAKDLEVNAMEDKITNLQEEMTESRMREQEAESESDRLRGELAALSAAYSSLEEDFNRRQAANNIATGAGAKEVDAQQPEGEGSSQGQIGSDVDGLFAENARLRNDARAADEWMQLAHHRMGEIGAQNLALQEELNSIKERVRASDSAVSADLIRSMDRCAELEREVTSLKSGIRSGTIEINQAVEKERRLREEMESKLEKAESDAKLALDVLRETKSKEEQLLQDVSELETELQLANASATALNEERRQLELQLESLQQDPREGELVRRLRADLQANEAELDSLRASTKFSQGDETDQAESSMAGLLIEGKVQTTDNTNLNEQLIQLQADNKAAQEWMAKAVEHHQMLSDQVAALSADKDELISQLQAKRDFNGEKTDTPPEVRRLEEQLASKDQALQLLEDEVASLEALLVSRDEELKRLEHELHEGNEEILLHKSEFDELKMRLESNVDSLTSELDARNEQIRTLEQINRDVGKSKHQKQEDAHSDSVSEALHSKVDALQRQITELIRERDCKHAEVLDLSRNLTEFEQWSAAAQERLNSLSDENEALKQQSLQSRTSDSAKLEDFMETLKADNQTMKERILGLEQELSEEASRCRATQTALEEKHILLSSLQASLEQVKTDAAEREKHNSDVADKWRERASDFEASLACATELLAQHENEASAAVMKWQEKCRLLEKQVAELEAAVQDISAENKHKSMECIEELESTIEELRNSLELAEEEKNEVITEWSARHAELDDSLKRIQAHQDTVLAEKTALEYAARCAEASLEKEREVNESISLQVQQLEEELSSAKSQIIQVSEEAEAVIEKWSARCADADEMVDELEARCMTLSTEKSRLEETYRKSTNAAEQERMENERFIAALRQENSLQAKNVSTLSNDKMLLVESVDVLHTKLETLESVSKNTNQASTEKLEELELALSDAIERLDISERNAQAILHEWENRCQTLEEMQATTVSDLQEAISEKQQAIAVLESQQIEFAREIQAERDARLEAERSLVDAEKQAESISTQTEEAIRQWEVRVSELESDLAELESVLEQQQGEAVEAITQWEATCSGLETRLLELESAKAKDNKLLIEALLAEKTKQLSWLTQLDEDCTESIGDDFETYISQPTSEFMSHLSGKMEVIDKAMLAGLFNVKNALQRLQEENSDLEEALRTTKGEIGKATRQIAGFESVKREYTESNENLMSELKMQLEHASSLQKQLVAAKSECENQSSSMKSKDVDISQMATEMSSLRDQLVSAKEAIGEAVREKKEVEKLAQGLMLELSDAQMKYDQATSEVLTMKEALASEKERAVQLSAELSAAHADHTNTICLLTEERDNLNAEAVRLADEFKSANEILQSHITDEVSRRATEMVTNALRIEVEQMRVQIDDDQDAFHEERRARVAAESEVASLKADLAIVLRVNDGEELDDKVRSLLMKTSDGIQRKERQEIEHLRQSLERALHELALSQNAERESRSQAESAELQASVCEQEIFTAKSDVDFLSRCLEETREAESARIASFEYRIKALEEDRDVVRRFHSDEVETLRNEIVHLTMERDRILHSLKESEKANSALVYSTLKEQEREETDRSDCELSKLRTSNVQLLLATTEEAARTERRIREAIAANASLAEADVLVERELRIATEMALENVKSQLDEARRMHQHQPSMRDEQALSPDRMRTKLSQARERSRKLEAQNESLKVQMEQLRSDFEVKFADSMEKCRRAQSLALKLEGEIQFRNEVSAAATKAHTSKSQNSSEAWVVLNDRPETSFDDPTDAWRLSSVDAYDYILDQKIAIQEERQMYQELLTEHDNLLALLAQQDMEKASLNAALTRIAGQSAVDAAIQEARDHAIQDFGKFISLSSA